jgi:fatty acid desaturase 2 (delta-6 desaturase)
MGKEETVYTWSEVQLHTKKDDKWLVMDGQVYNITNWVSKHPGGSKVISHYAGQDATVSIIYLVIYQSLMVL